MDDPATLGTTATVGGTVAGVEADAGLRVAWSGAGIALLEVPDPKTDAAVTDDVRPIVNLPRALVVGAVGVIVAILVVVPWRRRRRATPARSD